MIIVLEIHCKRNPVNGKDVLVVQCEQGVYRTPTVIKQTLIEAIIIRQWLAR